MEYPTEEQFAEALATLSPEHFEIVSVVLDYHNNLIDELMSLDKFKVCGVQFKEESVKQMEVVFPGGLLATPEEAIRPIVRSAINEIGLTVNTREAFAISGAMRWPWSREASIERKVIRNPFKIG